MQKHLILGVPLPLLLPIGGHILAGIAKRLGPFHPDLFTLEGAFEPLQDAEFIILPIDLDMPVLGLKHRVTPTREDHAVQGHIVGQVGALAVQRLFDDR